MLGLAIGFKKDLPNYDSLTGFVDWVYAAMD